MVISRFRNTATVSILILLSTYLFLSSAVADVLSPTVASLAISDATGIENNRLNTNDVLSVIATFSEPVTVTGTPQLSLIVGSGSRIATHNASASNAEKVKFEYTIQANDTDTDGISIGANALSLNNNGTIKDTAGNDAVLTHDSVADNSNYLVDTSQPDIFSTSPIANATNVSLDPPIILTFTESIIDSSLQQLGIRITVSETGDGEDFKTPQFSLAELISSGLATKTESNPNGKHQITLDTNLGLSFARVSIINSDNSFLPLQNR